MMQTVIHPLAPVFDSHSRILVLGTMPSPASRERAFYYMHTQNRFWPVLAAVFGGQLTYANNGVRTDTENAHSANTMPAESAGALSVNHEAAVAERRALALQHGIALWDVLASCEIAGAEDSSIRNPVANDFSVILKAAQITRIYCTGQTAFSLYSKLCKKKVDGYCTDTLHTVPPAAACLPSTSPANRGRWPFEKLVDAYGVLRP